MDKLTESINAAILIIKKAWYRYVESIFITGHQYRLKFIDCYSASNHKTIAIIQVVMKRIKIKLSVNYLASNQKLLADLHPVSACKIAFISNTEDEIPFKALPNYIKPSEITCSIIKENPTLKIIAREFSNSEHKTLFTIAPIASPKEKSITLSAEEVSQKQELLYALGSAEAAAVGFAASEDFLSTHNANENDIHQESEQPSRFLYFHILCSSYVALIISGISIVRRLFPYHIPFTHLIVPFGAGIIFFPLTFAIQDLTTEVYGFSRGRQMVWLAITLILFYILYTQIAIHLPNGSGDLYKNNSCFATVYDTIPRQLIALVVSLFVGTLINDFFISKSKVIFGGQYLWARLLGSTMIGEAVLQVVGGVIGFSDTMDFWTQLLPNMTLAYGYKLLWNAALIPFIYILSSYLKRKEGVDVFDYDVDYNPFKFSVTI